MKLNVNWKQLGKAPWAAIKPVLLGATLPKSQKLEAPSSQL